MSDISPILSLPYIQPSQAQKHVTHNEALQLLDVLTQLVVANRDQTVPPVPPVTGTSHIVAPGGTGAWAGRDGEIATWDGAAWFFVAPQTGWQAQVTAEAQTVTWDGAAWGVQPPELQNLDNVGIRTTADATNRLAVSAPATLFSHEGAGHQLKINKSTGADTASLLFQTGWSGRAEMGTAGSDDFSIKVSADGVAWATGVEIDPVTGKTTLPSGAEVSGSLTGTAVQQSTTDTTTGRLMRADYGYSPGNLLGTVSHSGGTPTGAVIEQGSNANGEYVRWADGTQICTAEVSLDALDITTPTGALFRSAPTSHLFPATFAGGIHFSTASFLGSDNATVRRRVIAIMAERGGATGAFPGWSEVIFWSAVAATATSGEMTTINLVATGRWFI